MKIAVCFSGQIRSGLKTSKNLIQFFGKHFNTIDFFVHTWDNNTDPEIGGSHRGTLPSTDYSLDGLDDDQLKINKIKALEFIKKKKQEKMTLVDRESGPIMWETKLDTDDFDKFLRIYNPIKYSMESYDEFYKEAFHDSNIHHGVNQAFPQWYSFYKSIQLKKEYEEENNFVYDMVVKLRPDIIIDPNITFKTWIDHYFKLPTNTFIIDNLSDNVLNASRPKVKWCDDVIYFSSSEAMNIASMFGDLSYNLERTNLYFLRHLKKFNVRIYSTPQGCNYQVVRDWCSKLFPNNDFLYYNTFKKINKLNEAILSYDTQYDKHWEQAANILIPMAGIGSRFKDAGYEDSKPFIDVNGKPMIQRVIENLNIKFTDRFKFIIICLRDDYEKYDFTMFKEIIGHDKYDVVILDDVTDGAAQSALMAKDFIDNDAPLLIFNSDQLIEYDARITYSIFKNIHGGILTFYGEGTDWSYTALDKRGFVKKVAEKQQISNHATAGYYYWEKGSDFVKYSEKMIANNERHGNTKEFYIAPVYNLAIQDGKKIIIHAVDKIHHLGTPEYLEEYLNG
jgi:dTDP-glucose pyrophosphorylase